MSESPPERPTNRLAQETSAYLRQHMHNPVDWHPWGDEALARARAEDRPLLVSIGYSACHWCHVMEHESFEDPDTAALMNRLFVNIKVDREERPDVDQIYMDTVTRLTGRGGWPLTVFCTPDGEPFYGGTYFPPEPRHGIPAFREVLEALGRAYRERRGEVDSSAKGILSALASRPSGVADETPGVATATRAAQKILQSADLEFGGFGGAPKFPTPPNLELLLAACDALPGRKAVEALDHVLLSCREMARRGLYDHLAGGFHRYSVDARWAVPHFEKMLYDQGQLLRVYAEAWRRTGCDDDDLLWPVRETAAYLAREMSGPEGGLYASQDADSEGEEGRFYVWTPDEIDGALGAEAGAAFARAYGVTARGNFEGGRTVLADTARAPRDRFRDERDALALARSARVAPGTDRKRVAAWNGLAISGLARAGSVIGDDALLAIATTTADFIWDRMRDERGRLLRVWNEGRAHVGAFLDDHAAVLEGCLDLHRAGAGERFLGRASKFADDIATHFFDEAEGDLFLTPDDGERLVHRPRSDHDGATPHSTGLATLGLLRVATLTGRRDLRELVDRVLRSHAFVLDRLPDAHPTLARTAMAAEQGLSVAVIVGAPGDPASEALATRARRVLGPADAVLVTAAGARPEGIDPSWLAGRDPVDGAATAYVCRGVSCSLPVTSPTDLIPFEEARAS